MGVRIVFIALFVVGIWGLNFVFIERALRAFSPLWLTTARFLLAAFPAALFVPRPRVPIAKLLCYSLSGFVLQFGCLFTGMKVGLSAGLASMILQMQVFFTMGLAVVACGERASHKGIAGALLAFAGIGLVALQARDEVSGTGLALVLAAALCSATGNVLCKRAGSINALSLVVWSSVIAVPALAALSFVIEGSAPLVAAAAQMSPPLVLSLAYLGHGSTLLGYSLWVGLLRDYAASAIAPFTLLVPIVGLLGSVVLLGEPMPPWKIAAAVLVVSGLAMNVLGGWVMSAFRARMILIRNGH